MIAQAMYDLAQKLSHMKYGWLIIIGFMSASLSSPPTFNVVLHYPCHHLVDDLTPWSGSSLDLVPTYDRSHHDHDVVRVRVRNEGILHRAGWVGLGSRVRLRRVEVPIFQTTSKVVRHE